MKRKKIVLLDMDNTLYDFDAAIEDNSRRGPPEMLKKGFFSDLKLFNGARPFVQKLVNRGYDVHICTKSLATSPKCNAEKVKAICRDFPYLYNKIILCQDKHMIRGDYLIDDDFVNVIAFDRAGEGQLGIHFDPKSPSADQYNAIFQHIEDEQKGINSQKFHDSMVIKTQY